MKMRLFHKWVVAFLAIGILTVTVAALLLQRELRTDLTSRTEEEMVAGARIIALMPAAEIARHAGELSKRTSARLTLIDAAGRVIADSGSGDREFDDHMNRSEIQEARLRGVGRAIRYSHTLKREMLYVALPLDGGAKAAGYVRLARPLEEITRTIDQRRQAFFGIVIVIVAAALLMALLFSLRMVAPIGRLAAFTGKIRTGNVSGVLRIDSRDEVGELSRNINEIVAVLQEKIGMADRERRKLESLFSAMSEGIIVLDAENRIESVNRGMELMSGRPGGEVVGRTLLGAFRNIKLHGALERYRKSQQTVCEEIGLGEERPVVMDVTISAVRGDGGAERKTMLVFHDVTRLKRLERIRTDFVANVTHEIRTPLTAIIGFAETLEQGALENPEMANRFLRTIRENAERLNRLVDDLLALSGLELGEAKLQMEGVRIEEALDRVLAVVGAGAAEKGLTIQKAIPTGFPPIRADRDRLAQILINILDNAIKFTPAGGTIGVTVSQDGEASLIVRIADTGIGILPGEIPRLGERFYRADKARSREVGGTGLGLSIVKHLMAAHGGRLAIESNPGRGTTVSLCFPFFREMS